MQSRNLLAGISRQFLNEHKVYKYRMKKVSEMSDDDVIMYCHWYCEENRLNDEKTSFLAELVSSGNTSNTYTFKNIAPLIAHCMQEKAKGQNDQDWNKVVLIPIKTETDSNDQIIGIKNSLNMESARLVGGKNDLLEMQILYTKF